MDAMSFQGVKQLELGAELPPHSRAGVAKELRLYFLLLSVPAYACHGVKFTFTYQ
jgi:hypothetical protein